jgi:hypothetical protein
MVNNPSRADIGVYNLELRATTTDNPSVIGSEMFRVTILDSSLCLGTIIYPYQIPD